MKARKKIKTRRKEERRILWKEREQSSKKSKWERVRIKTRKKESKKQTNKQTKKK